MNNNNISFIERQFPVSKISKESYKERKANLGQTLTGLGKWWGRKPLILIRASILGMLIPSSNDPVKDREIFLKILTMDNDGLWLRKSKPLKCNSVIENLTFKEVKEFFEVPTDLFDIKEVEQNVLIKKSLRSDITKLKWKLNISKIEKERATKIAFYRMSYDEKLLYCLRPEDVNLKEKRQWDIINNHLKTNATSLVELVKELGQRKFNRNPVIGDSFAGGGSIPFEAARMGCDVYASDLNPIAGLLTWSDLNISGISSEKVEELRRFQKKIFNSVNQQILEWGIETNEKDHQANTYLYCTEIICPECGYKLPLSPTWVIGKGSMTIAKLINNGKDGFDIQIKSGVSKHELNSADKNATIKDGETFCPHCEKSVPIAAIKKEGKDNNGKFITGLRQWEKSDFIPKTNDIFRERLYCIRYEYEAKYLNSRGELKTKIKKYYKTPSHEDLQREQKVIELLNERFTKWQNLGYIPDSKIEEGDKTSELIKTRGWRYWHQLFTPRQLLIQGLFLKYINEYAKNKTEVAVGLLGINKLCDYNSKLCVWLNAPFDEHGKNTFLNQALNPLFNHANRALSDLEGTFFFNINNKEIESSFVDSIFINDARNLTKNCDLWVTDPPYADAVNYHELSEFFLAWDKELIKKAFSDWYTDSKRVLAVKGTGQDFNLSMVEIYRNLTNHMPAEGTQIVMFTHQNPSVWADLTLILWSSGLRVTAAWNVSTETESGGLKEGNYVKGTVLLVLKKQTSDIKAYMDELYPEIEEEVKNQIASMRELDDKEDPNFYDPDYLLAAYAASLKVLTSYSKIEDINVEYELSKPRNANNPSPIEQTITSAIRIAYDQLIPAGFDSFTWKSLQPVERFYIKGLELEKSGVKQLAAYQEMARGFGIKDYKNLLASTKANQVKLKSAKELGTKMLRNKDDFSETLVRHLLMAFYQAIKAEDALQARSYLKSDYTDYDNARTTFISLCEYFEKLEHLDDLEHRYAEANMAKFLIQLLKDDGV